MWMKLLGSTSIQEGLRPQLVNGHHRPALIHGRNKAELKKMFASAGVPWIYENDEVNSPRSPYNRVPKVAHHYKRFETRLAKIAKQLTQADQKELEHRREELTKKTPRGFDRHIIDVLAALGLRDKIVDKWEHIIPGQDSQSKASKRGGQASTGTGARKKVSKKGPKKGKQVITTGRKVGDTEKRTLLTDF